MFILLFPSIGTAQQQIYIEPTVGLQTRRGGFDKGAPHLERAGLSVFSYGLLVRWKSMAESRLDYSSGLMLGGASFGYRASIPPQSLMGTTASFSAGKSSSTNVWHFPLRVGYQIKELYLNRVQNEQQTLKISLQAGPQLDYLVKNQFDNYNDSPISSGPSSNNRIGLLRTPIDSARWGSSIYAGTQFRYCRKGHERLQLTLYTILGLTDMLTYRLDYQLNNDSFSTLIRARTSAIGFSVGVPIRIWPFGFKSQKIEGKQ
ncbi:hypothetical protein GCM10022408_20680 [Hymenobacter fastidiosus]|uniref:Outer membrane protein beta-barrel domain-containing protein n=1 Tax=Hymenobacter fastidiosus TaxID=486264 RepID=A0ABP7S985_9BACT